MKNIDGQDVSLGDYQGDVLLLVNVASECGLTKQYKDLEAFYKKYKNQGVKVLAFPANNFGAQEPGTNKEIKQFCKTTFDVTFDLFSKVSVKGDDICDLYKYLTRTSKNGEFGGEIQWNFQKFLIDRTGRVVARFEPRENPMADKIVQFVERQPLRYVSAKRLADLLRDWCGELKLTTQDLLRCFRLGQVT